MVIISIIELIILYFYNNKQIYQNIKSSVNPTISRVEITGDNNKKVSKEEYLNRFYSIFVNSGIIEYAQQIIQISGNILEIDTKGGVTPIDKVDYKLKFLIAKDMNSEGVPFYFLQKDLNKIRITQKINGKNLELSELRKGDRIVMKAIYDSKSANWEDNLIELNIIKTE
jgi:hypothetical protein